MTSALRLIAEVQGVLTVWVARTTIIVDNMLSCNLLSVLSLGFETHFRTSCTYGFVIRFTAPVAVIVQGLVFYSVGLHGRRKFEFFLWIAWASLHYTSGENGMRRISDWCVAWFQVEHAIEWKNDKPLPLWGSVEDRCFRLPHIEAMFSGIDWSIALLAVAAELENNVWALQLNRNFLGRIVLENRRDYHLFDYCCNSSRKIVSHEVVEFSESEASGRSSALEAETDDAGGPTPCTPHFFVILLFFLVSF